jgi:multiple antibiotic resistance protein
MVCGLYSTLVFLNYLKKGIKMIGEIIGVFIKLFFLLTPFFVLSMFLTVTREMPLRDCRIVASRATIAIWILSIFIYFGGNWAFGTIGITIDAFRVGTGIILMISAIELVLGKSKDGELPDKQDGTFAVVPLAIPYTLGPGTIGALLVMGGEKTNFTGRIIHVSGITAAVLVVGLLLFIGVNIEKIVGRQGITILSKITGLVLAAIAAQVILTGVKNFLAL